ncbi:MAG: hypothetical protein EAZ53_11225 [Bacteroidetes bacterium]|nr:MAG: hypothetical protein EAZ53_11225 [Bacteroidota bacterium]
MNEINPWAINGNSISYGGNVQITGNNVLEFGAGLVKEQSAGKIGYGTFDTGALCIVGAGTTGSNRRIRFFNEGGATFDGQIEVNSNVWIKGQYALQFGPRVGLPDGNAASIKLGTSGTDEYLNIFGGTGNGKAYPARKVQIFTEGGGLIVGAIKIQDPWTPFSADCCAGTLLAVNGNTRIVGNLGAKDVCVNTNGTWCDYVFDKNYDLMKLKDVENFIAKNKHLPGVPAMLKLQMKKIEELTLYIIELEKKINYKK